jgi:purine-binding chemotaxis protein CheW
MNVDVAATAGEGDKFGQLQGAAGSGKSTEFISFAIGDDQYGVDIMAVREIKGWSAITHLPKQPDYVRGVLNLRGVIVPIIDLRCRFGQGLTEATPLHIVIIVQIGARQVGLLAEAARVEFLSGLVTVDDVMIALIDLPNLLNSRQEAELAN